MLLSLLLFTTDLSAKVFLVSVGISDYPGTGNDLKLPVNDAMTMVNVYNKNSNVSYYFLHDAQATKRQVLSALLNVCKYAGLDDIIVFYFSGHGYQGGFCAYDGFLTYGQVRKAMAKSPCRNKIIFADACFSGGMQSSGHSGGQAVSAAKKANVMLFLSSRPNEASIENPYMQNGFFTAYLQYGLQGAANVNGDRTVTAREIYDYVHQNVISLSNGRQHPVMWGRFPDNMPVMKW